MNTKEVKRNQLNEAQVIQLYGIQVKFYTKKKQHFSVDCGMGFLLKRKNRVVALFYVWKLHVNKNLSILRRIWRIRDPALLTLFHI